MSDSHRKNISTQLKEKATPQSEKTTMQKIKESVTDSVDRVKAAVTPESHKSTTQSASDKIRGEHDDVNNHISGHTRPTGHTDYGYVQDGTF